MVAPAVVSEMVTVCVEVYVPAATLKAGVAACCSVVSWNSHRSLRGPAVLLVSSPAPPKSHTLPLASVQFEEA